MRSWQYGDPLDVLISAEQGAENAETREKHGCAKCRHRDREIQGWGLAACGIGRKPGPRGFCRMWRREIGDVDENER